MKKRLSIIVIVIGMMMFSTTCFASMYDDLKNNPNYIYYGGGGTGISFFMDKSSLVVNKYEPPTYVIAFIKITYSAGFPAGGYPEKITSGITRYMYDYNSRKMYLERHNNGKAYWDYLNPLELKGNSGGEALLSGGEIAFYLAYNMSFYDEPISFVAKQYINGHK